MILDIVLFCGVMEATRYYNFLQLRNKLRVNQTPLSKHFDRNEWFNFCVNIVARDTNHFKRMMEHLFWNKPFNEIDKESMKLGLYTIASGSELHDVYNASYKLITDRMVEFRNTAHFRRDTLLPFIRINNLTTNHMPSQPLFQIYPIHFCFQMMRLYGDISLSKWSLCEKENGIVFYRKKPNNPTSNKKLLFFHGLGLGVVPYLSFINKFADFYGEIIIVEFPGISRNAYDKMYYPTAEEIVDTIANEFAPNDVVDAIGHSYGSVILSYLANKKPTFLNKRVYLDTFAFFPDSVKFWPQVFKPITVSYIFGLFGNMRFGKALSEIMFAEQWHQHLIHNATYYYEYCNLEYNLNETTMIIVGAKDHLINAYNIQRYMEEYYPKVDIRVIPDGRHGDAIQYADEIAEFIRK